MESSNNSDNLYKTMLKNKKKMGSDFFNIGNFIFSLVIIFIYSWKITSQRYE